MNSLLKLTLTFFLISSSLLYSDDIFKLYLSADRTGTKESGISIEQGIRTALDEVNCKIQGKKIELVILDHRGNSKRCKKHLQQFRDDKKAIAFYSGLHSPPILANLKYIHDNEILTLNPWAAAGPITRYPSNKNWIFRLSIDDSKAGYVISDYAIKQEKKKKPFLLLESTGWGNSNLKTMKKALQKYKIEPVGIKRFNWNLGMNEAKQILRNINKKGADVIFFVGNAPEGKTFAQAMSEIPKKQRICIRSHWGITGGDFPTVINKAIRDKIDLRFIQTRFSFIESRKPNAQSVFGRAKKLFPNQIKVPIDIKAPTGFIHAYDITKIFIEAAKHTNLNNEVSAIRNDIRIALENIKNPIIGLIKTYIKPFKTYSPSQPDAHEALNIQDFIMAKYGSSNEIILLK